MNSTLLQAVKFAALKHRNQKRKNKEATPYINHPIGVALILEQAGVTDLAILQAALLHDTVEDTETTFEEIEAVFGPNVRQYVAEVTDDKSLSKVERKRHQIEHTILISNEAKLIKLADKLHNLTDLSQDAPATWSVEIIQGYFVWSWFVLQGARTNNEINKNLYRQIEKLFKGTFKFNAKQVTAIPNYNPNSTETMAEALACYYQLLTC